MYKLETPLNFQGNTEQEEPRYTETMQIPQNRFKNGVAFGLDGGVAAKRFATNVLKQMHHDNMYRPVTTYDADGNKLTEEK